MENGAPDDASPLEIKMSLVQLLGFGEQGGGSTLLSRAHDRGADDRRARRRRSFRCDVPRELSRSRTLKLSAILHHAFFAVSRTADHLSFYFGGSSVVNAIGQFFRCRWFHRVPPSWYGALAIGLIPGRIKPRCNRSAVLAVSRGEIEAARRDRHVDRANLAPC